jgi:histone deacetylase complex subunit SAP30
LIFGLYGIWCQVLTNGDEVKLQRNALSVIEAPSGHEEYDNNEENPFSSGTSLGRSLSKIIIAKLNSEAVD